MKMLMLLLVSTLALLASPAAIRHNPHENLNRIIDLVPQYNSSLTMHFVEDLTDLTEGGNKCQEKFFCKVQSILNQQDSHWNITRNVKAFNRVLQVKCDEVLKGLKTASVQVTLRKLLEQLKECSQYRNLNGPTTTRP